MQWRRRNRASSRQQAVGLWTCQAAAAAAAAGQPCSQPSVKSDVAQPQSAEWWHYYSYQVDPASPAINASSLAIPSPPYIPEPGDNYRIGRRRSAKQSLALRQRPERCTIKKTDIKQAAETADKPAAIDMRGLAAETKQRRVVRITTYSGATTTTLTMTYRLPDSLQRQFICSTHYLKPHYITAYQIYAKSMNCVIVSIYTYLEVFVQISKGYS